MLVITSHLQIPQSELSESFVRASGPGGQNVNKVASAVELRFDVAHSPSLPEPLRLRLLARRDRRLTGDGVLVIQANRFRDQAKNREDARNRLAEIVRAEGRSARSGMGILAMIGSTAPFVGLFGTVWGIMNSFIGISKAQTTNLAVVAPGIAEALLATAIGLAAAIPAVLFYNHLVRMTKSYLDLVGRASGAVARLLSRDLERGHGGTLARRAE